MSRTLRAVLNESNPNKSPSALQQAKAGEALALEAAFVSGTVTAHVLSLPESAKAGAILRAFARTGASTGYKTEVAPETAAPGVGTCTVQPNGNILFNAADAVTAAEVVYVPIEGDIFNDTLVAAAASSASIPQARRGLTLLEAEVTTGIVLGLKTIAARGSAPALGSAALNAAGTAVAFNAGDVVTGVVRLKYVSVPGVGASSPALTARLQAGVDM